jgi:CRISPR/Cas system-associated exonuclease Cas4 (RecB family)
MKIAKQTIDFNGMMRDIIQSRRRKNVPEDNVLHVTELATCLRKNYLHHKMFREHPADTLLIFEVGNLIHEHVSKMLKSNEQIERVISEMPMWTYVSDGDFRISGTVDDLIIFKDGSELVLEKKSTSDLPPEASEHHLSQINFYMKMLGVIDGQIAYFAKKNMKTKSFDVTLNEELFKETLERAKKLARCLKDKIIPEAESKLDKKKNWECKFCLYDDVCLGLPTQMCMDTTIKKEGNVNEKGRS